jgi:enamine deaminase RidA (YjgF/YER057c/UK114 family)
MRQRVYSGTPWEAKVAYCRAVRAGNQICVAGTVAADEQGQPIAVGDMYTQAKYALGKIERALRELGASLQDVVRTRSFVTDMSRFEEFARAHGETFRGVDPAATCVEVSRLVAPEYLIEIEVDAIVETA